MAARHFLQVVLLAVFGSALIAGTAGATPMVSDPNLLSGLAANPANFGVSTYFNNGGASSVYGPGGADYGPQNATNALGGGPGKDFVFAQSDPDERAAITGFNSALATIRIWTASDLAPGQVTIYDSTTSQTSISSASYNLVPLVPTTVLLPGSWTSAGPGEYRDFTVSTGGAVKSLLFDFGATNTGNPEIPGFIRIEELQAFKPVPEPASIVLFGLGALGLFFAARRHRRA